MRFYSRRRCKQKGTLSVRQEVMLCKSPSLATVGGNKSWFYVLRVKLELSWAVYQLGVSEWAGRWLDKRQQQHKVCGQQQQPWLSISAANNAKGTQPPNHRSLCCKQTPTCSRLKIIRGQYYITLSVQLLCAIKSTPYLFYLLRHDLSLSPCARRTTTFKLIDCRERWLQLFFHFFCFLETVLCRSHTHTDTQSCCTPSCEKNDENILWGGIGR